MLEGEAATLALGAELASLLHAGLVVFLEGDLGAGKTTLARGILQGLGYEGKVKSPTYNLVEVYEISRLYFYHFDFYRFDNPEEWEEAGFREYFNGESVCLVEWPEKAGASLPAADLRVRLGVAGTNHRHVEVQAPTEAGARCLKRWQARGSLLAPPAP
ncbi:tRNA (adenosine(37)-N6)-threonylcarbamoyltransferase complex ATPase subunit type 1 TsaE [Nitrosovibrio sp. Nv17]|uniref:tRNA (adenosine(37)-N6)-threonylcarbamoyltransferase complex ATPase subunit type 1 TsaE n=1 Tax=Nitrosovibrio sp. Nv17 TaxID=1855339 RepID=UPI00090886BA|nr:tRNA (adenosine(37)-N6)-threonylcarbamoyltransferase complex ATPase subunit type 1 TsaE [Nitrosovibrio sp. Nv17]SFW20359.1 tRNA threonylcarbamoyladenosine biosynthesis protein TsaE [Nitrosovibrio sp. Nv17]